MAVMRPVCVTEYPLSPLPSRLPRRVRLCCVAFVRADASLNSLEVERERGVRLAASPYVARLVPLELVGWPHHMAMAVGPQRDRAFSASPSCESERERCRLPAAPAPEYADSAVFPRVLGLNGEREFYTALQRSCTASILSLPLPRAYPLTALGREMSGLARWHGDRVHFVLQRVGAKGDHKKGI